MKNQTQSCWHTASSGNEQGLILAENGDNIAVSYRKENAPVIAAAPELLHELIAFVQLSHGLACALTPEHVSEFINELCLRARSAQAVINKAEGEEA